MRPLSHQPRPNRDALYRWLLAVALVCIAVAFAALSSTGSVLAVSYFLVLMASPLAGAAAGTSMREGALRYVVAVFVVLAFWLVATVAWVTALIATHPEAIGW